MVEVVKIIFNPWGKIYFFSPDKLTLSPGDEVIVDTESGETYGKVISSVFEIDEDEITKPLKKVKRLVSEEDSEKISRNKKRGEEYFAKFKEKVTELDLDMKPVDAKVNFDYSKATFYFYSEERIDFRRLVKELNSDLKISIEMKQIGARDEARHLGGLGCCGYRLCCTQFISNFDPVSIKMAKEQNLPLSQEKISGNCGKLLCCLRYELDLYKEFKQKAPAIGSFIDTPDGKAKIIDYSVPSEAVIVSFENGLNQRIALNEIKK